MLTKTYNQEAVLHRGESSIEYTQNQLVIENERFQRVWSIEPSGLLVAKSFTDRVSGTEWLIAAAQQPGPTPKVDLPEEVRSLTLVQVSPASHIEAESLVAELTATGEEATLRYRLQVFPGVAGVRIRLFVTGTAQETVRERDAVAEAGPTGLEQDPVPEAMTEPAAREHDVLESLALAPIHLRLTNVELRDQTDHHNELVAEQEWLLHPSEQTLSLMGVLFYVEDVLTGAGLIFLKEAPLPYARPVPSSFDLQVSASARRFVFLGHGADESGDGYAFVTLAYQGGTMGRVSALQQYQRCLRPYVPRRDGILLSNTWGDRNRDGRIHADFMEQEIEAGARLGVDVIQIDDGWQVGTTSNSVRAKAEGGVWEGFYASRDNFWEVNPERFPNGLSPLVDAAQKQGMRFGLWFGPDSAKDFANWQRDAETILRLHRELGIEYIKIDGVKLRTKTGERNLQSFFDYVLNASNGKVVFDLDVTAEVRPGYFALVRVGPLFVENRYTDWHKYWPHQTLRNTWQLAHHVDPVRLRMEFLNHERNREIYANDPLAPHTYRPDYLFATVMFTAPLGWFEVSNLPASYFQEAAPLIATWKAHRDAIFSGTILPIGSAPDGVSWTGFASLAQDRRSAYLLLFREASPEATWEVRYTFLPNRDQPLDCTSLGGDGKAVLLPGNKVQVTIPEKQRFLFVHVSWAAATDS